MRRISGLIILLFLARYGHAQQKDLKPLSGNIKQDIKNLLPEGKFAVDIMDNVVMNPRYKELMEKFKAGIQENPEWFLEVKDKATPGNPLPYDKRMGLTEAEYKDFLKLTSKPGYMEMTKSGSETVTIKHVKDEIILNGTGVLEPFATLTININSAAGKLGEIDLSKPEFVNVTSAENGLRSKWKGYTWRYDQANKNIETLTTVEDYQDLQMKLYKVTIGRLETTGKTYIDIKTSEIENGVKTINYQIPAIFQ